MLEVRLRDSGLFSELFPKPLFKVFSELFPKIFFGPFPLAPLQSLTDFRHIGFPSTRAQSLARVNNSLAVISRLVATLSSVSMLMLNSPRSIAP